MEEPDRAAEDKARDQAGVVERVRAAVPDRVVGLAKVAEQVKAVDLGRDEVAGWAVEWGKVAEPTQRQAPASVQNAAGRYPTDGGSPAWTRCVPIAM